MYVCMYVDIVVPLFSFHWGESTFLVVTFKLDEIDVKNFDYYTVILLLTR